MKSRVERYKRDLRENKAEAVADWHEAVDQIAAEEITTIAGSTDVEPLSSRRSHYPGLQRRFIELRTKFGRSATRIFLSTTGYSRRWMYQNFCPWSTKTDK